MHAIEHFCETLHIKNKDLAEMLGIKPPTISGWKSGKRKIPKQQKEKMCEIFKIPREKDYLLEIVNVEDAHDLTKAEIKLVTEKLTQDFFEDQFSNSNIDPDFLKEFKNFRNYNIENAERDLMITELTVKIDLLLNSLSDVNPEGFNQVVTQLEVLFEKFKLEELINSS